jgi:hypothetical protein
MTKMLHMRKNVTDEKNNTDRKHVTDKKNNTGRKHVTDEKNNTDVEKCHR